jgi:hypothetical protein
MILATCAALALALANPASAGSTFRLMADCPGSGMSPAFIVRVPFRAPVIVEAAGRKVGGIDFAGGGNVIWRGGTIEAPGGAGWDAVRGGPGFYAVFVRQGARSIVLEGITFTNARKAIVWGGGAAGLAVRWSLFTGVMEDGLIAGTASGLEFSHNSVRDIVVKPRACTLPGGTVTAVGSADCTRAGGVWRDGWHSDALQLMNGTADVVAAFNVINTAGQGLTQMDQKTDAPIRNVRFHGNTITAGRHGLTLDRCDNCLIDNNTLRTSMGHLGWRAVIIPGRAKACGNIVPSGGVGREAC